MSVQLRDVAEVIRGVSFDKAEASAIASVGTVPVLRAGNIGGELDLANDLVWVPSARVAADQLLRVGDIVVCMSSGSASVVGKSARLPQEWHGSFGAFCAAVRPGRAIDSQYLALWLRSPAFLSWRDSQARGANIQNLRASQFGELQLPSPALAEQRRIAARLTEQFAAVERVRAAALDSVESVSRMEAGLLTAIASQISNAGWPVYPLDEIALGRDAFADGPFGSNLKTDHYAAEGARVIRLQNIGRGRFLGDDRAFIPMEHYLTLQRHDARPGDVVVAALGSGARPAGRACELPEGLGPALVKADCFRVRLPDARILPAFLVLLLNGPNQLSSVAEAMRGATRPRVTLEMVRRWAFPLPPVAVQTRLLEGYRESRLRVERAVQSAEVELAAIEALPAALLREAFSSAA